MSETESCIRGCTMYRYHVAECDGVDDETCRGCLPRRANHGHLCDTCHRRFELMLHDAPTVIRWLGGNMGGHRSSADADTTTWVGDRPELGSDQPLPMSAAMFDVRQLMTDRLALWVDHWCEVKGLQGPGRHTPETDVEYLLTWLPGICKLDWIGDWWEEMAETMSEAHALAPWRPAMRRVPRVPCPGCGETNLAIFGGESDITCLSCKIVMTEERFGLWERVLRMDEVEAS